MYTKVKIRFISHCRLWADILGSHCVTVWEHNTVWEHCYCVTVLLENLPGENFSSAHCPHLWASAPAAELDKPTAPTISLTTLPSSEMFLLLVTSRQIRHGPSEASGHLGCPGDLERPETQDLRHPSPPTQHGRNTSCLCLLHRPSVPSPHLPRAKPLISSTRFI